MFDKIAGSKWKNIIMFITVFAFVATSIVAVLIYKLSGEINGVAQVNGREIPFYEFNYSYEMALRNLEAQNIDTSTIKKEVIKQTVENLIETELLYQQAQEEKVIATPEQVKREILNIPAFQVNGKFDKQIYLQTINAVGLSPEAFENILKKDISVNNIRAIILSSIYVSDDELSTFTRKQLLKVSGKAMIIKPKEPLITQQQAKEYYEKHKRDYSSKQDKKIAIYKIDINKVGQEKAEIIAKDSFSKIKLGQEPSGEVEKLAEGRLEDIKSKLELPADILSSLSGISENKTTIFIKDKGSYYIASYKGEVFEEIPFESVKDSIIQKLKNEEFQRQVEKLHNTAIPISELLKNNTSTTENIDSSTIQEVVAKYGIKPDDISKIVNLKLGQTSKAINIRDGILFFTLQAIAEPDKNTVEDMKKSILPLIKNQKFNEIYQMYIDKLKEKAKIKINKRILEDG